MSATVNTLAIQNLIQKIKEEKMMVLFSASMGLEGTPFISEWLNGLSKTPQTEYSVSAGELVTGTTKDQITAAQTRASEIVDNYDKALENFRAKNKSEIDKASIALKAYVSGMEKLVKTQQEPPKPGRKFPIKPIVGASFIVRTATNYEQDLADYKQDWDKYQKEMEEYEKSSFYVFKKAICALIVNGNERELLEYLKINPAIALFMIGNIDTLKTTSESFFDFSQIRLAVSKSKFKAISHPVKKQKADLKTSRDILNKILEDSHCKRIQGPPTPSNLNHQPSVSITDNVLHTATAKVKTATAAARPKLTEFAQNLVLNASKDTNKCLIVLKSKELCDQIPDSIWAEILQTRFKANPSFPREILKLLFVHEHLVAMTARIPLLEDAVLYDGIIPNKSDDPADDKSATELASILPRQALMQKSNNAAGLATVKPHALTSKPAATATFSAAAPSSHNLTNQSMNSKQTEEQRGFLVAYPNTTTALRPSFLVQNKQAEATTANINNALETVNTDPSNRAANN